MTDEMIEQYNDYMSNISILYSNMFSNANLLSEFNLPNYSGSIYYQAFTNCVSLSKINIPNATYIGSGAFMSCKALKYAYFPKAIEIGSNAFNNCANFSANVYGGLSFAYFDNINTIQTNAFYMCSALSKLIITNSSMCVLKHSNAFVASPLSNSTYLGTYGSIYVPSDLVDTYKSATYWSQYKNRITSITDEILEEVNNVINGIETTSEEENSEE
jgi:hypothetical protein